MTRNLPRIHFYITCNKKKTNDNIQKYNILRMFTTVKNQHVHNHKRQITV